MNVRDGSRQVPAVVLPKAENMSPVMEQLTDKAKKFVIAMVETGGRSHEAAAIMAGVAKESARTTAWRWMRDERVLAAIQEQARKYVVSATLQASATLQELLNNADPKVRLKAAEAVLDRGGILQETINRHLHVIEDRRTDHELEAYITETAKRLGIDPLKLLGRALEEKAAVIDAEYEEVASTEGIEDLL